MAIAAVTACEGVSDRLPPAVATADPEFVQPATTGPGAVDVGAAGPRPAQSAIKQSPEAIPKAPPVRAAAASPRKPAQPTVATAVAPQAAVEASLDVAALKARLRDTTAMGVLAKLALRNEMDDLLNRFRALHDGGQSAGVASLRPSFDSLLARLLSEVQEGDPSLARTISASREAIWRLLADPERFRLAT